jgi:cob(I)alamin adenosyltransferase
VKISKITTRKGDQGETSLLYGGRVPKSHARTEAYGSVDEAVSALGLARALSRVDRVREIVYAVQKDLFVVGAELATDPAHADRLKDEYTRVTPAMVKRLDDWEEAFDAELEIPRQFVIPGDTPAAAALDLARTLVRRAERRAVELKLHGGLHGEALLAYLNRLSDLCFILARYEERFGSTTGH